MKSNSSDVYFARLAKSGYQPLLHRVTGTLRFNIDQQDGAVHTWYVRIDHGDLTVSRVDPPSEGGELGSAADCVLAGSEAEFESILAGDDSFAAAFVRGAVSVTGDHTLAQNIRRFSPPAGLLGQLETHRHAPTDERAPSRKRRAAPGGKSASATRPHRLERVQQSESGSWPTTKQ
jgi:SCP-2 sterol transfer family